MPRRCLDWKGYNETGVSRNVAYQKRMISNHIRRFLGLSRFESVSFCRECLAVPEKTVAVSRLVSAVMLDRSGGDAIQGG
jgi:Ni,Fe-hydrogenase I large subunit